MTIDPPMNQIERTLEEIRGETLKEARSAPVMFADLAKLEQYVSESYRTRSFIELLQNADDAGSSRFRAIFCDGIVIVANDGRAFSNADIRALCRSGASSKKRHEGTIGYRGVGFKSVVSLATRVHVASDNASFTFSQELTRKAIGADIPVPLVRMPHPFDLTGDGRTLFDSTSSELVKQGFTTFFVFEGVEERRYQEDITECDPTILLFLNHVTEFSCQDAPFRESRIRRSTEKHRFVATLIVDGQRQEWIVCRDCRPNGSKDAAVAFRRDDRRRIVPCSPDEAVVHSFLPTTIPTDAGCKLNGDFSTDPSRTKIDLDATSLSELRACAHVILHAISDSLSRTGESVQTGIFDPLDSLFQQPPAQLRRERFSDKLREFLIKGGDSFQVDVGDGKVVGPGSMRLGVPWLNDDDADQVVQASDRHLVRWKRAESLGKFSTVLGALGIAQLGLDDLLASRDELRLSDLGCAEACARFASEYRFGAASDKVNRLRDLPILKTRNGVCTPKDVHQWDELEDGFVNKVYELCGDRHDFVALLRKLGLDVKSASRDDSQARTAPGKTPDELLKMLEGKSGGPIQRQQSSQLPHAAACWRRAETNLAAVIEREFPNTEVEDVSRQNLGFDLLVKQRGAVIMRVEVKSVQSLRDTITLTNNEYSCAVENPDTYVLAIVLQLPEHIEVVFIENPLAQLTFTRRVVQWQWVCEEVGGKPRRFEYPGA